LEPQNGTLNESYLQSKIEFVNRMGKNGFYTLLEFHQDLCSEKFCGEGVPMWAIPEDVYYDFAKPPLSDPPV
jgi:endoglycosylceramidase